MRSRWASLALVGPAFAVSIGYMDPGNWATDLAAGAYGYRLLWVVLASNAIAIVLQLAVTQYTLQSGQELGVAIARRWPKLRTTFWALFQGAAIATDLAEFTGIVLGLQLLFHLTMPLAIVVGFAATFALLSLGLSRSKRLEYTLMGIVGAICLAFALQLRLLHVDPSAVALGALWPTVPDHAALFVLVGIVGATVMPHNLFLHSALVRRSAQTSSVVTARFFARETFVALNIAALVNAGILVVGAALPGRTGTIEQAFVEIGANLGAPVALAFAAALLLSGLAASTTATMSGDYIFAAFSSWSIPASARRFITLLPAALTLLAGVSPSLVLVWSQVALALVLPAAIVPLIILVAQMRVTRSLLAGTYVAAGICVAFDAILLLQPLLR